MKEKLLSLGGVMGSFLSFSCCAGLIILYSLGVSGTVFVFLSRIAPYRPLFIILTIVCLGSAHYRMDKYSINKRGKIFIWLATIIAIIVILTPVLYNIFRFLQII